MLRGSGGRGLPERGHEKRVEVEQQRGKEGVRSLLRREVRALFQLRRNGTCVVVALLGWSGVRRWLLWNGIQRIAIQKVIDRLQRDGGLPIRYLQTSETHFS